MLELRRYIRLDLFREGLFASVTNTAQKFRQPQCTLATLLQVRHPQLSQQS